MSEDKLKAVRDHIDALDEQLQALINERAACAQTVASLKNGAGAGSFYRPEREAEILRKILARNQGPLSGEEVARLFREIMSACLALEQPLRIAYLGPEGTFTQAAVLKHFGHSVTTDPHHTIDDIFREVEAGGCHYGVVPVENSTGSMVTHTLDMFLDSPLKITGEVQLRVHQNLLSTLDAPAAVRRVYSHQQSLAQCRVWLDEHLAGVERIAVSSNAEAARLASQDKESAAIAGREAADIYGLKVLAANIEDEPDNTTRFLVIGRDDIPPSGNDKTSLLLSAVNKPGALYRLLSPLAQHGISMTRIESRPSRRGVWEYVFFVDIEGHAADTQVAQALEELRAEAAMLKVLGSYPRAIL
ncbi:MAG: prephenate dehydratase [Gammaproteobacteria bacterium]|jgi:chorismate mutase/prephenate dehydratase